MAVWERGRILCSCEKRTLTERIGMTMIIIIGKRKHVFKTLSDPHKLPSYVTYKGLTQGQEEGEDEDVNKLSQVSAINVCLNERILWRNLQQRQETTEGSCSSGPIPHSLLDEKGPKTRTTRCGWMMDSKVQWQQQQ